MYSVLDYDLMAACGVRMDAYARAIARAVKPGDVVVDIGAGTGIMSLLAARAGARRVHAVEPNPAVWLIPDLAAENGCRDRIEIHACTSFDLELTEKADVVISDLRGAVPLHDQNLASLRDAKARLLKPGGTLIPARDRLFVAAVTCGNASALGFARRTDGFIAQALSARAAQASIVNSVASDGAAELRANDVLTTSACWATIEYGSPTPVLETQVKLQATRRGVTEALAVWFEGTIAEGLTFDNAPGTSLVYSRLLLPFLEPLTLAEGDHLDVTLRADERGGRWAWDTRHVSAGGTTKATSRQGTFLGEPTSPDALVRAASNHKPLPSARGERLRRIFDLMDGSRTVVEIANTIQASSTTSRPHAVVLDEVRDAVERYAR